MKLLQILFFFESAFVLIVCLPTWNNVNFAQFVSNNSSKKFRETSFDDPEENIKPRHCQKNSTCESLKFYSCLGVKLPYSSTSLSLLPFNTTQEDVQERLLKWKGLMQIPRCWAVVQPFLCSLYMPKCENGLVDLPSLEMCEVIRSPCRILQTDDLWPEEFRCHPSYKSKCKNDVRELKFNTSSRCKLPLVQAEQETSFYEGIEGCGIQCHDPLFSDEERQEIRTIVIGGSVLAFLCNLFAVLSFIIDWKAANKYPAQAVFYINFSFLLVSFGYLYQFRPGANDHTICRKDGTLRTSEPSIRENLSCVTSFVFVYYFLIAGLVWFVIFAYAWQLSSQAIGKIKDRMDKKGPYYHLVAWSLPLVLTITIMALGEIDGDSALGVCFVGVVNKQMRVIFLLIPLLCSTTGLYFFIKCIVTLIHLKITSKEVMSANAKAKICESIARVLIFLVLTLLFGVITFICHIYDFQHHHLWKDSFKKFIVCQLGVAGDAEVEHCRIQNRPSVLMMQLQVIALFGMHMNMATWVWTSSTIQTWSRFINKLMNREIEEPLMFKKHKVIARAFAKRKFLNSDGRISISIYNSRQDPVGLNFELNSMGSNNLSTTWAKSLPKLITRRGALTVASGSNSSQRRNSIDSEISYSVRRVSVESRRHSLDSTVSVQAVEVTKTVRKRPRNKKHRKERNNYKHKSTKRKLSSRRNSNVSQASNLELETEVLTALKIGNFNVQPGCIPNMNRRLAVSSIEKSSLKLLGIGVKLLDQQGPDENSSSNNSLEVSKHLKSEYSESASDSESCHENDPLK